MFPAPSPFEATAISSPFGDHATACAPSSDTTRGSEPSARATISPSGVPYATYDPSGEYASPPVHIAPDRSMYARRNGTSCGVPPSRGTSSSPTISEAPSGAQIGPPTWADCSYPGGIANVSRVPSIPRTPIVYVPSRPPNSSHTATRVESGDHAISWG